MARPVDRERAAQALDALHALADPDPAAFEATLAPTGILGAREARPPTRRSRDVLDEFLGGPATLDAAALLALGDRAAIAAPDLATLAAAAAPQPQDLALGRMLGQVVALLARLGATEDWVALSRPASGA